MKRMKRMKRDIQVLSAAELTATGGGDWDWGDFMDGVTYALGVSCYVSGANPLLCGAALVSGGIGIYL